LIAQKLQKQTKALCFEYKNATSLEETNVNMLQFNVGAILQGLLLRMQLTNIIIGWVFGTFV
jgi:hypothetical protein